MTEDQSYLARAEASRERMRALIEQLDDDDFTRPFGDGWTVGALFGHLAHWDRYAAGMLEEWARTGRQPAPSNPDATNAAELPRWIAAPGRAAAAEALAAAEACDRVVANLSPEIVDAIIAAGRPRSLDRSIHRNEHLDHVEQAISSA